MTGEQILNVIDRYDQRLNEIFYLGDSLKHVQTMLPQMREFVAHGRFDKVFRWLGFVQGVLYCQGVYTIDQMKAHNSPQEM